MPYQLYIDGRWQDAAGGTTTRVYNPATGEPVGEIAYGTHADAARAMDAAAAAFPSWKQESAHRRGDILDAAARLMRVRVEEIARVLTLENGKPLRESRAECLGCAEWFEWFAEEGKRLYGRMIPSHVRDKRHWVLLQPVGVVGAINPWNFPVNLMSRKVAAALAAGCTIVTRPASQTPLSSALLFECLDAAGCPRGTVNFVPGDADAVTGAMLSHPACRKLSFTGSTAVGKRLHERTSRSLVKISLELGGNAPLLVFPDVDIPTAVEQTVAAKFRCAGQACVAPNRIYVHEAIFDRFADAVVARTESIVVGNGLDEGVGMGPLFHQNQLAAVEAFVVDAVERGARVLTGGRRLHGGAYDKGTFYAPTVIDRVTRDMRLSCEEVFGPILPLIPFTSEEEVVAASNDTRYGLAAYVLTRDLATALRVSEALEFGVIGLNDTVPTVPHAPFGGWKESGMGREGGYEGLHAYTETKYVSVGL
jgi:succinate-semialdehyde dehydrogenase/glutarate-semialdehyde dehydrogenase